MALDRFVYWTDRTPTKEELGQVLKNYVGDAGTVTFEYQRWTCILPGRPTRPLKGIPGFSLQTEDLNDSKTRWFEVCWHERDDERGIKASIDVITREQDEFTNGVAERFQKLCLRAWQAIEETP